MNQYELEEYNDCEAQAHAEYEQVCQAQEEHEEIIRCVKFLKSMNITVELYGKLLTEVENG